MPEAYSISAYKFKVYIGKVHSEYYSAKYGIEEFLFVGQLCRLRPDTLAKRFKGYCTSSRINWRSHIATARDLGNAAETKRRIT